MPHKPLNLKNRAFVVPNGIDLSVFSVLPPKEILKEKFPELRGKKIILFLSRIHRNKGLDTLIRAFAVIAKEQADVHLVIAGRDDGDGYEKALRKSVSSYNLGSRVSFVGMLSGREKLEAFTGSDIFVLPSYSESFGMACVEAMACGVPVIISDKVGIHKEVMKNNACIVVEPKIDSLYKGIKSLLENDSLRQKIGLNGRKFTEKYYNIEKAADMMIEEYKNILK